MTNIYIWKENYAQLEFGHSSLQLANSYISWWPTERIKVQIQKIFDDEYKCNPSQAQSLGISVEDNCLSKEDSINYICIPSFEKDCKEIGRDPDFCFRIKDLDEEEMLNQWNMIRFEDYFERYILPAWNKITPKFLRKTKIYKDNMHYLKASIWCHQKSIWHSPVPMYDKFHCNCSHVVYQCLKAGKMGKIIRKNHGLLEQQAFEMMGYMTDDFYEIFRLEFGEPNFGIGQTIKPKDLVFWLEKASA